MCQVSSGCQVLFNLYDGCWHCDAPTADVVGWLVVWSVECTVAKWLMLSTRQGLETSVNAAAVGQSYNCITFVIVNDCILHAVLLAWWDWPLTWLTNHCPSVLWPVKSSPKWPIMCRLRHQNLYQYYWPSLVLPCGERIIVHRLC